LRHKNACGCDDGRTCFGYLGQHFTNIFFLFVARSTEKVEITATGADVCILGSILGAFWEHFENYFKGILWDMTNILKGVILGAF